jgi:tetratricopeptide (TPR) repeat protein
MQCCFRDRAPIISKTLEDYNQSIALAPNEPDPYLNRGMALKRLGRRDEANADFQKATVLNPGLAIVQTNYAPAHYQIGQTQDAIKRFRDLMRRYRIPNTLICGRHLQQPFGRREDLGKRRVSGFRWKVSIDHIGIFNGRGRFAVGPREQRIAGAGSGVAKL